MDFIVSATLVLVGVVHLLPLTGALGSEHLSKLYGTSINEPNLEILMRHRAALFGILGVFLLASAFTPQIQAWAFIAGFISVASFLWLSVSVGGYNPHIGRVFKADIVALVCLLVGAAAYVYTQAMG